MNNDFDLSSFMRELERDPQLAHLYRVHPHFDAYPKYLQDGLIANERAQGRYTRA